MTAHDPRVTLTEVLAAHRYRDVRGDYDAAPHYKHFGCSCGWERNIAGMSGWRSWVAAHEAHVAEVIESEYVAARLAPIRALAEQWNDTPDYMPSEYDRGRVDQRHDMTGQLYEALDAPVSASQDHDGPEGRP